MSRSIIRNALSAAIATLVASAPSLTMAQASIDKPTAAEIHAIEAKVRMPPGAASLRKYVRYYHAIAQPHGRAIAGLYVAKVWFKPSEIPIGGIVVVDSEAEILPKPPEDAGCGVVFVQQDPDDTSKVKASCGWSR